MKKIFLIFFLFLGISTSARADVVCSKEASDPIVSLESCRLAIRVLQGLLVAQDNSRYPKTIDLRKLETALTSGKVEIPNMKEFLGMAREQRANQLYQSMMRESGQEAPVLKPVLMNESSKFNGAAMSTGTRGGGFDINERFLQQEIWY